MVQMTTSVLARRTVASSPPLVLQDPVTPSAGLDLEDEDGGRPACRACRT
jgi:hypothetical protein